MPRIRQQQALISPDFLRNCCVRVRGCACVFPSLGVSFAECSIIPLSRLEPRVLLCADTCHTVPPQIGRVSPRLLVPRCELDGASRRRLLTSPLHYQDIPSLGVSKNQNTGKRTLHTHCDHQRHPPLQMRGRFKLPEFVNTLISFAERLEMGFAGFFCLCHTRRL